MPYVGESGRNCEVRFSEHKRDIRNGNRNNALFVHLSERNHSIDWENAKVIYKIKNEKKRKIVESAVINSVKNVNISDGFYNFDSLTSKYVIEAANLQKTVKDLNELISSHGDIT